MILPPGNVGFGMALPPENVDLACFYPRKRWFHAALPPENVGANVVLPPENVGVVVTWFYHPGNIGLRDFTPRRRCFT